MTTLPPATARECGCTDPGLLRCTHFDGRVVQLIQMILKSKPIALWHVCDGTGGTRCGPYFWDDEAGALAAFDRAEEQLLAGADL